MIVFVFVFPGSESSSGLACGMHVTFLEAGAECSSVVERLLMEQLVITSIPHSRPTELFRIPAMLHDWCNKGHGMCYPEPFLLIGKSSPCNGIIRFPLLLSGPLPYFRCHITKCVECVVK